MKIVVDTREQKPLWKPSRLVEHRKLDVGDYTTPALFNKYHAERKSPGDLYGSIVNDHDRFKRMLIKAQEDNIKIAIFVECSHDAFVGKRFPGGSTLKVRGPTLAKICLTIEHKYNVPFYWCKNRHEIKTKMRNWFKQKEEEIKT